ncbi:MAG: DUF4105 domain-containing protein [Gammaproteobacteria bacterium]|nr:DUF4105 domain-containing protein [Gammaproteobacteria bacterium]
MAILSAITTHVIGSDSPIEILQKRAVELELHHTKTWQQLLHYSPSKRTSGGIESQVDDARFFNSPDGKTNPKQELLATIGVLFEPQPTTDSTDLINGSVKDPQTHPRCRFVSREQWLREQLELPKQAVPEWCTHYYEWRKAVGSHSMSLVFPASYLNSPSSMFGHTLLRLDPENIDQGSDWLSWSLNFAADTGDENFSAGYAFKGIAGGYAGKFNSVPYFKKLQEYGAIENRDIWEYELDFSPTELDRMLDHAWELRDIAFDYYFFRQNCSYRLLELMDYARPTLNLTEQFRVTTIPADTVKAVAAAGIVRNTQFRASLGSGIQQRYTQIPRGQRHWVSRIAQNPDSTQSDTFQQLDPAIQATLIRTANDLLTYRSRRTARSPEIAKRRLSLLKQIASLPSEPARVEQPANPESAHDTRVVSLTRGRELDTHYSEFGFRWSYHDILDRNTGYLKGAGISLLEVQLRHYDSGENQLQSAELVKLQSLSDRALIFKTLSWNLSAGLFRNPFRNQNRLAGRFSGNIGKSTEVFSSGIGYALLGVSASQYSELSETYIDSELSVGLLHYHRRFATQIELKLESPMEQSLRTTTSITSNFALTKNNAARFSASHIDQQNERNTHLSLQYRFYF